MGPGGMSETGDGAQPQVFVVDSQASYLHVPVQRRTKWAWDGQKFLLLLVGLTVIGLFVEGFLINNLYQRTRGFSSCNHLCKNMSGPSLSSQQGTLQGRVGSKDPSNVLGENDIMQWIKNAEASIQHEWFQKRPFAHLLGPSHVSGEDDVVQWVTDGETGIKNMQYKEGRLKIQEDGHYYLYSKVQLIGVEECKLIQHKVMKNTSAYGMSIDLMQSKSNRCWIPKQQSAKTTQKEELWSSFLAGIFHLHNGDEIFVTVEKTENLRPGPTENFMGAFMVSP
ncbi:tumor necrosis factor ligand superfamily member 14 isoform X1 [Oryzias melastigma]|uniref:Tumor necrosis factor ligand superfamily member 14-like n=1 Tax=Oryzias melastigma TaxID=30732 RepID=A0A3B3D6H8_ORYME|nr:tumor necrosis factor ligand superfamily member 14 isoform X1 [Oryzias melastigma]XP_024115585.1 tumor necrosis factor ligand superfamily member 14 isoform X1 [Oryzias melastigma]XP_036071241.1 tumor necrosis factor ligand superfamily member 14 isoform X1 [Oryzias melastigma]